MSRSLSLLRFFTSTFAWFPPGLGKPGKMGDEFPVREKSGNFAKTRKFKEFYPKHWKNQEILTLKNGNKYWKSEGNLAVRKVKTMEIKEILGKRKKIL